MPPSTSSRKGTRRGKIDSQHERKISAMLDVNLSLQTLSSVAQSGWKANSEVRTTKSTTLTKVSAALTRANDALSSLRVICPEDLDVERAASSMMSKLLVLEMHDASLPFLSNIHARLLSLLRPLDPKPLATLKAPVHLLSLPLPMVPPPTDTSLLTLISTYLMHAIVTLTNITISSSSSTTPDAFSAALLNPGTLLTWLPYFVSLPHKHTDTVLTRAYTVLTKSSSSFSTTSRSTFLIRVYALKCLLRATTGTVQPPAFWDQVQKACTTYVKTSSPMSEAEELSLANLVSQSLDELVHVAHDKSAFVQGKSFVLLCETWASFAKRSNDLRVLERITDLIAPGSSVSSSIDVDRLADNINQLKISNPSPRDKDAPILECARACAILIKVTACLDVNSDQLDDFFKQVHDAEKVIPEFGSLLYLPTEPNDELLRAQGKLRRTLERLRRACIKILDGDAKEKSQVIVSLLMAICTALESAFKLNPSKDILTTSLDSLFIIARVRLNCHDPDTYTPTLDLLNRTVILLDSTPDHVSTVPVSARANYIRCISGAYHNLAGSLYQSSKYGGAVRFLKEGCALGARALHVQAGAMQDGGEDSEREEGWKQLEEQLFRRWELLAVCYSKIGDRKLACDAFLESMKTFPYRSSGLENLAKSATPTNALNTNASTKQLGTIVDRLTYAAACELFFSPSEVSLVSALKLGSISDEVLGLLLERQVSTLEPCLRKDGVQAIVLGLLQDTLSVYETAGLPFRRARVLLKCMEFLWKDGNVTGGQTCWTAEHLGEEVLRLLNVQEFERDSAFAPFRAQYTVAVHLWLSLFAYRSAESSMTSTISYHVEAACKVLRGLIPSSPSETSPKTKRSSAQAKKLPKDAAPAKKSTRATGVRTTSKARALNPITPRPRKALENVSNVIQSTPPKEAVATIDVPKVDVAFDLDLVVGQLQMNVRLLGLLGLVLLKVKLLEALKRLCECQLLVSADLYLTICVDLASEYIRLGKTKRANSIFARGSAALKMKNVSDEMRICYLLKYAEILAFGNDVLGSASSYCEAMALSEASPFEDKTLSTAERIKLRAGRLERAAMACRVSAATQYSKNNVVGALDCMLQSLRLWNRAVDTLSRLSPPSIKPSKATDDSNPFEATPAESSSSPSDTRLTDSRSSAQKRLTDGMEWRMVEGLLSTLLALTHAYFTRGSAREAEYFAQQALDLAESVNAPTMAARALMRKGEIQLYQRQLDAGRDSLAKATELLRDLPGVDGADMRRLKGDWNRLNEQDNDARDLYEQATTMLGELDGMLSSFDGSRRKSSVMVSPQAALASAGQGAIVPTLLSDILRRHIWLMRDDGHTIKDLLEKLMALPASQYTKGEEHALMGKLTLHSVYEQFRLDMFLSSLAESTIALPMGMTSDRVVSLAPSTQDILSSLDHAEQLFWADLALTADRGDVSHVREAAVHLALIRALQTSLGKGGKHGPIVAARLLDASSAITLRREMLETVQYKYPCVHVDDLEWPLMTSNGSPLSRTKPANARRLRSSSGEEGTDDDCDASMKAYWDSIRNMYAEQTFDSSSLSTSAVSQFPPHWTVVHISLTPDKSTLFISRQNVNCEPLMFCVPLKGRRESDDGEHLTFDDAVKELAEIIRLSDEGTRNAVNVRNDDPNARTAWWVERKTLDKRMQELLENIEFCWLGAFKTILSPISHPPPELIADLRTRLEKVFKRIVPTTDKKQKQIPRLSDVLLDCFSSLSPKCREEELEDLLFFILDLYTFHGIPVAIADVDVDQVTVDLRCALEEHAALKKRRGKATSAEVDDSHVFLVLDRNVLGIPWESIPVLRGQSVSRIPSVAFLHARVRLASAKNRTEGVVDRISVDSRKTFFVLNPSGDLKGTEGRFRPWLEEMRGVGWEGIIGQPPSEQQFLDALARKDLVIYFGHGGGEQYVRSHKIRHLQRCAATMLWGCSSGSLKDMGEFDRVGTPFNYMLAGCPLLVANLWDVTDRDIDKFSQVVFDSLRLTPTRGGEPSVSVVAAVAQAREACKLKYLTGAAPVVYGIPFYL